MRKLLLFSSILIMFVAPMLAARDRNPVRGLRRAAVIVFAFNFFYWFAIRYIYPRL